MDRRVSSIPSIPVPGITDAEVFSTAILLGSDGASMTFELDGDDTDLVPVPLGEKRKIGSFDLLVGTEFLPVKQLTLKVSLRYVAERISAARGEHYSYGLPGKPALALSQYRSEVAGVPVHIDQYTSTGDGHAEATLRFPSGVELPGKLLNPRISDMSRVDTRFLNLKPVTIKLRGCEPLDGSFIHPNEQLIPNDVERREFEKDKFLFVEIR